MIANLGRAWPAAAAALPPVALGLWLAPRAVAALRAAAGPAEDYAFGAADQLATAARLGFVGLGALAGVAIAAGAGGPRLVGADLLARWAALLTVAAVRLAGALLVGGVVRMGALALGHAEPGGPAMLASIVAWSMATAPAMSLAAAGRAAERALGKGCAWSLRRPWGAALLLAAEWLPLAMLGPGTWAAPTQRPAALPLSLWDPGGRPAPVDPAHALGLALAFCAWAGVAAALTPRIAESTPAPARGGR